MKLKFNLAEKLNKPSFAGFQHKKSDTGANLYEFNVPYDESKYDAYVEILEAEEKGKGQYTAGNQLGMIKIPAKGLKINLAQKLNIPSNKPFTYRYKLVNKNENPNEVDGKLFQDSGTIVHNDYGKYNLVTQLGSKIDKGGAMYLLIPDSFNVGWVYNKDGSLPKDADQNLIAKAKKTSKTFSNKYGGTIAGIVQKIPALQEQGYTRIVSTPMFTDDSVSDHGYWIKNAMQMSQSLGSINDYGKLIRKMFQADMNLVADGAFVNEGLEGTHFRDVLKRGEDSPYYNWFRAEGLRNGPLGQGVFAKNHEFISHRVINSPHLYVQDEKTGQIKIQKNRNEDYNPNKPTMVQIYDTNHASVKVNNEDENPLKVNTHEDTIIDYSYNIDPDTYNDNIERLNEFNKKEAEPINLNSYEAARILTRAENFSLEDKFEGGFETWDANNDIAKLNFYYSKADLKTTEDYTEFEDDKKNDDVLKNNFAVQDYAIASGKYWSKKTNDIILGYVARQLKDVKSAEEASERINKLVGDGKLPESVKEKLNDEVVKNIFNKSYKLKINKKTDDSKELMLSGLMDLPLDSIELGDDVVAVLGYPYITNRAHKASELGKSRYELYKKNNPHVSEKHSDVYNKTTNMYTKEMMSLANDIMNRVNDKMKPENKLFNGAEASDLGKYVLPMFSQEIAKFAVIKALVPDAEVKINTKTGEIGYNYADLKTVSLNEIGVTGLDAENDAKELISKIKRGIKNIVPEDRAKIADAIYNQIDSTNENSFKLAETIIDRTQAGLDWRIDAAKDVADVHAIRNSNADFEEIWQNATDFWKQFSKAVHKENPNSYMAAEITDVGELYKKSGKQSRYGGSTDAERKFLQETGINTTANYGYFFTDVTKIFTKGFEDGTGMDDYGRNTKIENKLTGEDDYLHSAQLESLIYSYTFAGNHDKPRALHCLAMDMSLFHSKFDNLEHKVTAAKIINDVMTVKNEDKEKFVKDSGINFNMVSPKAIAMADVVRGSMGAANSKLFGNDKAKSDMVYEAISKSVSDLAQGHYLDTTFTPDAFGVKPFDKVIDMVIKQAEAKHGLDLNKEDKRKFFNKTFEEMIVPAMTRMESLMGFLVALPGNPTLFAGDELGLTGYEEKCKNVYLQNRSFLNWDLLTQDNKEFLRNYNEQINKTMALRKNPRLKALNTGAPFSLGLQHAKKYNSDEHVDISAVLRQNTDGEMVVSLFNPTGFSLDPKKKRNEDKGEGKDHLSLEKIILNNIPQGISVGTRFYNIKGDSQYIVCENNGEYSIKRSLPGKEVSVELTEDTMENSTLILTTVPPKHDQPSFEGRKVLYNPQYHFVSNPYQQAAKLSVGVKLKSCV